MIDLIRRHIAQMFLALALAAHSEEVTDTIVGGMEDAGWPTPPFKEPSR